MTRPKEPVTPAWVAPPASDRLWVRAGFVASLLWVVAGVGLAYVSAQAGKPTASGWLALLAGPVMLAIVGRRFRLRGWRDWLKAGLIAISAIVVVGGVVIFFAALAGFGT